MATSKEFLDQARDCFRRAAETTDVPCMQKFADLGREYLRRAHEQAELADSATTAGEKSPPH
jgi:hypothetical protein